MERENSNMELTTIDDLNDDCLEEIFSYLTIKERLITEEVCKRWKGISTQGWHIKDLRNFSYEDMNQKKTILHRCGRFLKFISVSLLKNEKDEPFLRMIPNYCPRLEEIHIILPDFKQTNVFKYYRKQFRNVCSKLQQLHTVMLYRRFYIQRNFSDYIYINDFKCIMNLRKLSLFNISITGKSIEDWKQLHLLTSLILAGCDISGEYLQGIRYLDNLETLSLYGMKQISDRHLAAITNCSKLTELCLTDMSNLTNRCFDHIAQVPNLRILKLTFFPVEIAERSITKLRQIHSLHLCSIAFPIEHVIPLIIESSKLRVLSVFDVLDMIDNEETWIKAVNEAVASRKSSEKFTLRVDPMIVVENLSPRLILENCPVYK